MFSILTLLAAFLAPLAPACPSEDATGVVCTWDASESGNGIGQDFLVIGSTVITLGA